MVFIVRFFQNKRLRFPVMMALAIAAGMLTCGCSNPTGSSSSSDEVTTLAGSGDSGSTDDTGTKASFNCPYSLVKAGTNLYVVDAANGLIRQIVISSGAVTTLTREATFSFPCGIATDGTNLYVADSGSNKILQIAISSGAVTTLAGSGDSGATDDTGTKASFNQPYGLATDGTNLYVADMGNHVIRQIVISSGVVTTLAGTVGSSGSTDATGTSASFYYPFGLATDGTNLYVADTGNNVIRQIVISSGAVTTLAGTAGSSGSTDDTGAKASFHYPVGLAMYGTNLYVADTGNNKIRQIVISSGAVTTLAGSGGSGSANGSYSEASFNSPFGVACDGTNVYVADKGNNLIRKIKL
jgi:hypothetical protein